ncbi:MAG TPA: DUF4097 family beta strand repeat-containing protein [Longimicrobium sp.]
MTTARALACLAALALAAAPLAAQQQRVQAGRRLDPTGLVRVWNEEGSLRIVGWDRDSVAVTGTVPRGKEFQVGGTSAGVKITVDHAESTDTAHLEVRVPRRSQVWVKTAGSRVSVSGLAGNLDVYSVTGPITVNGALTAVTLESMGGEVSVGGSAVSLRVKTASGAVRLSGRADDAVATTVSGPVRLEGVRFRRARVESVDGDLRYAAPVPAGSSLELTTHGGGVEMVLPRGTAAELNASTFEGVIRSALPGSPSPRPKGKGYILGFTLGRGGSQITIRSFRGAVTLRHP